MRISNNRSTQMAMFLVAVLLASSLPAPAQPPDNAALLYYQAFQLHGQPDETIEKMMWDLWMSDGVVTAEVMRYVENNRHVIDLAVKAADITNCDWGNKYSLEVGRATPYLGPLRDICFLLNAETRWLTNQGRFATALDRCVTLRKMALHASGGALIPWLTGTTINERANQLIQDTVGLMPPDVNELGLLKYGLIRTEAEYPSLASSLTWEAQVVADAIHKDKVQPLLSMYPEGSLAGDLLKPIIDRVRKGDDKFFDANRDYYLRAMDAFVDTLDSGASYTETFAKLEQLPKQWSRDAEDNPDATVTSLWLPATGKAYQFMARQQSHVNALKTAIDLYIVKAKTGRLPDALPADSAPDLFSGRPFLYEKSKDGFTLRCRVKEHPDRDEPPHEYAFKVR